MSGYAFWGVKVVRVVCQEGAYPWGSVPHVDAAATTTHHQHPHDTPRLITRSVVAWEPVPQFRAFFEYNLARNGLQNKVQVQLRAPALRLIRWLLIG